MGCGCGKVQYQEMVTMQNLDARGDGYTLATFPDCLDWHHGKYEGLSIYVVARHTELEKLFARTDLVGATEYMKETGGTIENIATAELCNDAVLSVYGAKV